MTTKVALVQMTSTRDKASNFKQASKLIAQAKSAGAQIAFLPEGFDYIAESREETFKLAETIDGPIISKYCHVAAENSIWLSLGGAHIKSERLADERIRNTHIIINSHGQIVCSYAKVHLFDVDIKPSQIQVQVDGTTVSKVKSGVNMSESKAVCPGQELPPVVRDSPVGNLGVAICYDVRFPELASYLRYVQGAHTITYPAAFMLATGEAGHWHALLRARAIDYQCYVIAAAQEGAHNPKRSSYGHSIVFDPWGQLLAEKTEPGPGLLLCDLGPFPSGIGLPTGSTNYPIEKIRQSIPIEMHRRFDLFPMQDSGCQREIGLEDYKFGPHIIKASCVFYRSAQSFAFVNLSPLVPGHILVSPVATLPRFDDLSSAQIADLYMTVKRIAAPLAKRYSATSLTVSIQDGKDAGQSVPHVHVHVLPRKPNDFPQNDDIYQALQNHDKIPNRILRSEEVMFAEASDLRSLFYN